MTLRMGIGLHQSWKGWLNISNRTREHHNHPHTVWPSSNRFHIVTVVSVEEELIWIWKTPMVWVNGISDYPPNILNFKRSSIGSISFSDWICLRCHWTQVSLHTVPCVGFSMFRNHYLKIINSDQPHQDFPLGYCLNPIIWVPQGHAPEPLNTPEKTAEQEDIPWRMTNRNLNSNPYGVWRRNLYPTNQKRNAF